MMTAPWIQAAIVSIGSIIASSGFWAFIQKRDASKSATARLLMGLAYDKIAQLGLNYIERGWITKDEYEEFRKYLYEPYRDLGGNGVAERIMVAVAELPLKHQNQRIWIAKAKRAKEEEEPDDAE
jgi:hypothetical protein